MSAHFASEPMHGVCIFPGKSDPYCRLGLLNEKYCNEEIVRNKDLLDWSEAGMIGDGQIKTTTIKTATLEPEWNELVEMLVMISCYSCSQLSYVQCCHKLGT